MKKRYCLIDTENLGNSWMDCIGKAKKKEVFIIFYSKNHSHLLEKTYLKQRHNQQLRWVECITGHNALDYQLMGVLSYLIAMHPNALYSVCSNDKDYQNIIHLWQQRGIAIERINIDTEKKTKKKKTKKEKTKKKKEKKQKNPEQNPISLIPEELTEENMIKEIAKAVPVSNLNGWHKMMCSLFGQEQGREYYIQLKKDEKQKEELSGLLLQDELERKIYLVALLYRQNQLDVSKAEEALQIVNTHNKKNKKEIKEEFDKHFGKTPDQMRYYTAVKPVLDILKGNL